MTIRVLPAVAASTIGLMFVTTANANEIIYQCVPHPPITVADGDLLDLDPQDDIVRVAIDCTVDLGGGNIWRAVGTIVGDASDPDAATTEIVELTIWNASGNIAGGMIRFDHYFPPAGTNHSDVDSAISGHFDNLNAPGFLGGGLLTYLVRVHYGTAQQNAIVINGATGYVTGLAPIPFDDLGAVTVPQPHRHEISMSFYLDTPGDAIIMGLEAETTAACAGDLNGDNVIDVIDLLAVLAGWGTPAGDVTGDGMTNVQDLLTLLTGWGPCD